jgi:hypothetical protein
VENFVEIKAVGRAGACQIRPHSVLHHDGANRPRLALLAAASRDRSADAHRLTRTTSRRQKNIEPAAVNDIPPR